MPTIQTLQVENYDAESAEKIAQALEVFSKLAVIDSNEETNGVKKKIFQLSKMWKLLEAIITKDLDLEMDSQNIILTETEEEWINLDLANTFYSDDEKANIYYIFYGFNFFLPIWKTADGDTQLRVADHKIFEGLRSFWYGEKGSFMQRYFPDVEHAINDIFSDQFYVLSLLYLAINGYDSYEAARDNGFRATYAV